MVGAIRLEAEVATSKEKVTGVSKMASQKNGRIRGVRMVIHNTNVRVVAIENHIRIENISRKT